MGAKRREQRRRKIRVETQIFPQLRQAQEFCALICAAQPERGFAPVLDFQRRINLLVNDISRGIVVNDFYILQLPGFRFWAIGSAACDIICNDVVVGVLLKHLHVVERIAVRKEILNEPGAGIGSIAKNLSLDIATGTRLRFGENCFSR